MGNALSTSNINVVSSVLLSPKHLMLGAVLLFVARHFVFSSLSSSSSSNKRPRYLDENEIAAGNSTRSLKDSSVPFGILDVRRRAQLALGRAMDHGSDVTRSWLTKFDLNRTIFHSVDSFLARLFLYQRLAVELYWSDRAVEQIQRAYEKADADLKLKLCPIQLRPEQPLLDFMATECNFSMEHADGSFLDHLRFCYEYSQRHYRHGPSARILLLHSIMGVGTNFFPMTIEKVPQLKGLLTDAEFTHIEVFPSILRLVNMKQLMVELTARANDLSRLRSITVHRVIDNTRITLTADELWVQLNYQLIHLLDFLPASNWAANWDDNFLSGFTELYALLVKTKNLQAFVDVDLTQAENGEDGRPLSLARVLVSVVPGTIMRRLAVQAQAKLSKRIGHSLSYDLVWA